MIGVIVANGCIGFHSIGFPSEQGNKAKLPNVGRFNARRFHSIGFPSEQGTEIVAAPTEDDDNNVGFHSIGFPSEQGSYYEELDCVFKDTFPFNWFPQRVGNCYV